MNKIGLKLFGKMSAGYLSFVLIFLTSFFSSSNAFGQNLNENVYSAGNVYSVGANHPYYCPTPGEIPILAVTPVPSEQQPSLSCYKTVEECGFNTIVVSGNEEYISNQFKLTEGTDLKLLIKPNTLYEPSYRNAVNRFKNEPRLAGWTLYDEPAFDKLPQIKEWYDRIFSLDPRHLILINLIGAQMANCTGPTKDYREYLQYFQKMFKPSVWSYDLYPLSIKNRKVSVSYDIFYSDFEMFMEISKQTKRPFWAFCQGMGFKNYAIERPNPTEAYLRFEAFSALAYGAQGIIYWTYGLRHSTDSETYTGALVDLYGRKMPAWYDAQKVNRDISKYKDVFYGCNVKEVRHTGDKVYKDTKKLTGAVGPFSRLTSGSSGVLVSNMETSGRNYIVIVSHDVEKTQRLTLYVKNGMNPRQISDLPISNDRISGRIQFVLPKGGVAIFEY